MPKTRRKNNKPGAKSISVQIKHKIGGRKSSKGVKQMSDNALASAARTARKKDRFKIKREWDKRGILTEHLETYYML